MTSMSSLPKAIVRDSHDLAASARRIDVCGQVSMDRKILGQAKADLRRRTPKKAICRRHLEAVPVRQNLATNKLVGVLRRTNLQPAIGRVYRYANGFVSGRTR